MEYDPIKVPATVQDGFERVTSALTLVAMAQLFGNDVNMQAKAFTILTATASDLGITALRVALQAAGIEQSILDAATEDAYSRIEDVAGSALDASQENAAANGGHLSNDFFNKLTGIDGLFPETKETAPDRGWNYPAR